MKLKLKHITPYLPYGAFYLAVWKSSIFNEPERLEKKLLNCDNIGFLFGKNIYIKSAKIILHPTSDIYKHITYNGEKFKPFEKLGDKLFERKYLNMNRFETSLWLLAHLQGLIKYKNYDNILHWIYQDLIIWKFDIFGLIKEGLAIDINTIEL